MIILRVVTRFAGVALLLLPPVLGAQSPTAAFTTVCTITQDDAPEHQDPTLTAEERVRAQRARGAARQKSCETGRVRALAALLDQWAPAQQSARSLDSLVESATLDDATIFAAASRLAQNRSASIPARIAGLRLVARLHDGPMSGPMFLSLAAPETITDPRAPCSYGVLGGGPPRSDDPIRTDLPAAVRDLTDRIARDGSEPAPVRAVARCIRRQFRPFYVEYPPSSAIQLSYVCDLLFQIRNDSDIPTPVTWEVRGTSNHGQVMLPPRSQQRFIVSSRGDVQLYLNRQLVQTATDADKRCP